MNSLLDFWLPSECVLCRKPPAALCSGCRANFPFRLRKVRRAVEGFSVCDYQGSAVDLVHAYKRGGSKSLAKFMAQPLADLIAKQLPNAGEYQQGRVLRLVPVPSRRDSFRRRGFVPARMLAESIASQLRKRHGIRAHVAPMVSLTRRVQDQAALNLIQRQSNLSMAMRSVRFRGPSARVGSLNQDTVVMVDDVITTGSTLREMARALVEEGWKPLFFVTFAETL